MNSPIFSVIGHQPVTELKPRHLIVLLKGIEKKGVVFMRTTKPKPRSSALFGRIRMRVRNGIPVPFDAKNRERFLFRTIDELEQAPDSHD
ncbi:hypothetical protein [Dickeya zeae]|uniref:hypothetical protein n=1 Tax=Dickeya zeae TaxID=204042 RepID=UPI00039C5501